MLIYTGIRLAIEYKNQQYLEATGNTGNRNQYVNNLLLCWRELDAKAYLNSTTIQLNVNGSAFKVITEI